MNQYEANFEEVVSDIGSNVLIQASAGTGKTYNLVQRVLAILGSGRVPIDQILVLTFTEAAAAEMQSRIYAGIKKAEEQSTDPSEKAFFAEQKLRFARHRIGTIHSFTGWVIRQSGDDVARMVEHPVPDGFELPVGLAGADGVGWTASYELIDEYMSAMLASQWRHDFVRAYNGSDAVTGLLEAAGSMGRFFELLERASKLSDELLRSASKMDAQALISITSQYAKSLHNEMEAPFGRMRALADEYRPSLDRDFPASLDEFIEVGGEWYTGKGDISRKRVKNGYGDLDRDGVVKRLSEALKPLKALMDLGQLHTRLIDAVLHGDLDDNPTGVLDATIFDNMKRIAEVSLRWKQYHRWRRATDGLMNFDDLIDVCHRLLLEHESTRLRLQARFRHILVDEFQDTDARQWDIVKAIHGEGTHRKLFLVGDMKQAIYGFRGGNVSLIRKVEVDAIENPDTLRLSTLTVSRRSSEEIVDFVNGLFAGAMDPVGHEKTFQATYMPLAPLAVREENDPDPGIGTVRYLSYESLDGFVAVGESNDDRDLADFVSQGKQVIDAYKVAHFIAELRDDVDGKQYPEYRNVGDKLRNGSKAIGILLRTQSNVDHLMTAFRLFGLQATVRAGSGFFDRQEVSDLYYLVRFLDDAWDNMALAAVLRSPYFAVSDLGLLAISNQVKNRDRRTSWWVVLTTSFDDLTLTDLDKKLLEFAVSLLEEWRVAVRGKRVSDVLALSLVQTAFLAGQPDVQMATENAHKLIDLVRGFEDRGSASIGQVSNWLRVQMDGTSSTDAIVPGSSSIEITTMHRSKGLQYPMVILSNITATGQPNSGLQISPIDTHETHTPLMVWRSAEDIASSGGKKDSFLYNYTKRQIDERENAEALRLLYVALTRAESHIVISDPSGLGGKTNKQQKLLSDHIADLEAGTAPKWLMHEKIGKNEYRLLLDALMSRIGGVKGDAHQIRPLEWLTTASLDFANELAVAPMTRASDHDRDETTVATLQENPWKVLKPNDAGTLIHMMLEWPELEQEVLDQRLRYELEGLDYSRQDGITDDITLLKWHADNARAYLRSNFPDARQFISEMPVEAWLDGGQSKSGEWLRGTIDLLIEDADGIWHLIDFKTAKVPEGQLKDHVVKNKYNVQLKHYLAALAAVSSGAIQVKPSQAVLLFTAFDQGRSIALAEF